MTRVLIRTSDGGEVEELRITRYLMKQIHHQAKRTEARDWNRRWKAAWIKNRIAA